MLAIVAIKLLLFVLSSGVESLILERPDLRLSGGNNPFEGRIEILHDGEWSRLCFSGWSIGPADVVCRYLGIETGAMSVWTDPPDENDIPKLNGILVTNQCASPRDCLNLDETTSNCDIIGVRCNFPGYLGCFDENDFDSSKKCFDISRGIPSRRCYVDIDSCIRYCTSSGLYMYAGVTNGNECRCRSSTSLQSDQSESNSMCNKDCKRDDSQKCGDYAYIGVYSTSLGACGGTFSTLEGSITSPRFPDQFASDQECEWTITVPSNYEILLSVVMFELDYDRDNDIKIEYREPGALEEVIRLRGSNKIELPYHIEIPANIVEVIFRSEGSQGEGFVINYEAIPITTAIPTTTRKMTTERSTESGDVTTKSMDRYTRPNDITTISGDRSTRSNVVTDIYVMITDTDQSTITDVGNENTMGMNKGVDTGLIAGIVIALLLAIVVIIIVVVCVRRRKSEKTKGPDGMYQTPETISQARVDNAMYGNTTSNDHGNYFTNGEPTYAEIDGQRPSLSTNPKYLHLSTFDATAASPETSPIYQDTDMSSPSYQDFGGAAPPNSPPHYFTLERDKDTKGHTSPTKNGHTPAPGGVYLGLENLAPSEYMHLQHDNAEDNIPPVTSPKYYTLEKSKSPDQYAVPESPKHKYFTLEKTPHGKTVGDDAVPPGDYEDDIGNFSPPSSAGPYTDIGNLSPPQSAGPYTDLQDIPQSQYQTLSKDSGESNEHKSSLRPGFVNNIAYDSIDNQTKLEEPEEYEYLP